MNLEQLKADQDAAKRMSDAITLHLVANGDMFNTIGKWVAIRLSDGGSDNVLYDTREDAIRHQFHELQCCYVKIPAGGMPVKDAARYIQINRDLYDKGFRMTDPEGYQMNKIWPKDSNLTPGQKRELVLRQRGEYRAGN